MTSTSEGGPLQSAANRALFIDEMGDDHAMLMALQQLARMALRLVNGERGA